MTSYRSIASNSSGVVEKVMVNEGEYVHDWEPLFLIKSPSGTVNKVELGLSGFISNVKVKRGDQVISNMTLAILEEDWKAAPSD
jgi:biotin carboxyl carrier protein